MAKHGEMHIKVTADTNEFDKAMNRIRATIGEPKRSIWHDILDWALMVVLLLAFGFGRFEMVTAFGVVLLVGDMLVRDKRRRRQITRKLL